MSQTNPWGAYHWFCLIGIVLMVYETSGIGDPRNRAPLPQIETATSGVDRVGALLQNLGHLK